MSVENENIEPVTELGLSLSYSSQRFQRFSGASGAGAGANAGTRVDLEFAATDPLSELVWSPQNGLSLKCADCSFGDKKQPLLWGAGPSNVVLSPSQNITAENFIMSQGTFHRISEMDGEDTSARIPGSDTAVKPVRGSCHEDRAGTGCLVEETNNLEGTSVQHINGKDDFRNSNGERISEAKGYKFAGFPDELRPDFGQNEVSSGNPAGGDIEVGSVNQTTRMETVLASEAHHAKECEVNNSIMQNLTSPGRRLEKSASFMEKERKNKRKLTNSRLDKLESTSENDLRTLINKNVCGATNKIVASESVHEAKDGSEQDEHMLPKDKTVSGNYSPTNSRILRNRRKGKEKALSDGDVNGRMLTEDDDSHESVESCNSAGLFSTGKKRWNYDQQLIGSKKVKKQIHESPGSASYIKQDSSFMNWISNMMKGFSKSNEDDARSLAHTLAHPDTGHESHEQKLIKYNKKQDHGCRNIGFQSIFQSLYCPKTKVHDRTTDDGYQQELEHGNQLCDINATPLACHGDNDNLCQQFLLSNEKFSLLKSGNEAIQATQPKISLERKGGADSNSSTDKHKTSSTGKVDSEPSCEAKISQGSNPLGSLWITRFTPKPSAPLLNLEYRNRNTGRQVLESSMNFHRFFACRQNLVGPSNDLKIVEAEPESTADLPVVASKELRECAAETEASVGCNRTKGQNEQILTHKLNPILPSPRLKYPEAMASVFAKRLDALKHFMPSAVSDDAACAIVTCFFCGRKGHQLRDCAQITDSELEDLLRNINSYDRAEELPCLCIRCFQLNHWAADCPSATSRCCSQSGYGGDHLTPKQKQLDKRNDGGTKLLDNNKSLLQAAARHSVCYCGDPKIERNLEFNRKLNEGAPSNIMTLNANPINDYIASSSGESKLKDSQSTYFSNFICSQISEVPKAILDSIKSLRLSRTDILKWMNLHMSIEHLNGFYLRLRLGKWEEGLGGTGYYVACIIGARRESSPKNPKISIYVNIGGIKCVVESQYISNHDFLEDELMAWWSATTKSGAKIPTEEDLKLKINERKVLGL